MRIQEILKVKNEYILYTKIYCYILNQQCLMPKTLLWFLKIIYLLFIFWLCWVFVDEQAFLWWGKQGLFSSCGAQTYCGASLVAELWVLGHVGSVVVISQSLGHRLNGCGTWA